MAAPILLEGTGHFNVDVKGESHYQDNLETICGERSPDGEDRVVDAILVLDDANPYDPNAVRVDIEDQTVGYLSRDVAPHFREYMANFGHRSASFQCQANIRGGWDRGGGDVGRYGVWLDLPREPAVSAPGADAIPKKKPRRWIKIIGLFILVLFFLFVACVIFGFLLQALGVA